MSLNQREKTAHFQSLHDAKAAFIIPNPWDCGSARILAGLGFKALATTSVGLAFTLGKKDGDVTCTEVMEHIAALVAVTSLPVSADLENGFDDDPAKAAEAIKVASEAGASGGSIEDYSGGSNGRIYDFNHAVERVAASVEMARSLAQPFVFAARAENLFRGHNDLDDTIARLQAFEKAGADVLFAPGLKTIEDITAVCSAVSKPVNVLATPALKFDDIEAAGGKRISLGGALARASIGGLLDAARTISDTDDFSHLASAPGFGEINKMMDSSK